MRRRRVWAFAVAAIALVVGAWAGYVAWRGWTAVSILRNLQTRVTAAGALETAKDLPNIRQDVAKAASELRAVRGATGWLTTPLGWAKVIPGIGADIAAVPHLLELGVTGLDAANAGLEGGQPMLEAALGGKGISAIAEGVADGTPAFIRTEQALRATVAARARISEVNNDRLRQLLSQLDRALPLAQRGVRAALALPDLMGMDGPRTYLLIGQNNDELRATGGFIGTTGLITIDRGQIAGFDYRDSYAYAGPATKIRQPPWPYVEYMGYEYWYFRDSNWWADFPTSVRKGEEILKEEMNLKVDGAIALDQDALVRIVGQLGKVEVPGLPDPLDAANVVEMIEIYAHPTNYKEGSVAPEPPATFPGDRKAFVTALAKSLVTRMQKLDAGTAINVVKSATELLEEKHLILYFHNPEAADLVRAQNWDGAVPVQTGDTLLVVETNVGYTKSNKTVRRRIGHEVELSIDLSIERETVTVSYENPDARPARHCQLDIVDFFTADDSCYKTYLHVYAPPDSQFMSAEGFTAGPQTYVEGSRTVFAGTVVLHPGESKQIRVSYRPPRGVMLRTPLGPAYRLTVQKQPGEDAVPFSLRLKLPPDTRMASSDPGDLKVQNGVVALDTDLLKDRAVQVVIRK